MRTPLVVASCKENAFIRLKRLVREILFDFLERRGYVVTTKTLQERDDFRAFFKTKRNIEQRFREQHEDVVTQLQKRYARPVLGRVKILDLLKQLAYCIDPCELDLGCASQLTHTLQVVGGMRRAGINDTDILLTGLLHDIGKVMLLHGETPEHVESGGRKIPLGNPEAGSGLANCTFQWDHCDIAYSRLRDYVPDHVGWLLRHHGIDVTACKPFMDARDRKYVDLYFHDFTKFDIETKSMYSIPTTRLEEYTALLAANVPKELLF